MKVGTMAYRIAVLDDEEGRDQGIFRKRAPLSGYDKKYSDKME